MLIVSAGLPIRQPEKSGDGAYGASRAGGKRVHYGIDLCCYPGTIIYSTVEGNVTKLGYPYTPPEDEDEITYRYVQITHHESQQDHRFFYVDPTVALGDEIKVGDPIGTSQDISARYPVPEDSKDPPMTNHMHYEVKIGPGKTAEDYINPEETM